MTLPLPLTWDADKKVVWDANGNTLSPSAIVNRLSLYDDLVRAVTLLNEYRSPDTPAAVIQDVEMTVIQVRFQDQ